jgi:hypothetical protein
MFYKPEDFKADLEQVEVLMANAIADGKRSEEAGIRLAWIFVKAIRHGRLRCRNNKALNNYLAKVFQSLRFEEVSKYNRLGKQYMGLRIVSQASNVTVDQEEGDDADSKS